MAGWGTASSSTGYQLISEWLPVRQPVDSARQTRPGDVVPLTTAR